MATPLLSVPAIPALCFLVSGKCQVDILHSSVLYFHLMVIYFQVADKCQAELLFWVCSSVLGGMHKNHSNPVFVITRPDSRPPLILSCDDSWFPSFHVPNKCQTKFFWVCHTVQCTWQNKQAIQILSQK